MLYYLCHTMACFHMISIALISGGDDPCAPYLHYCYVPWLIMTLQWVITLIGMPHCGITMGNAIARDINCDIRIDNYVAMCTQHGMAMDNDIAINLFCYV